MDWINALARNRAHNGHSRAVTCHAAHFDLWIGCLIFELTADDAAHGLWRIACRADAACVGHKYKSGAVYLNFLKRSTAC